MHKWFEYFGNELEQYRTQISGISSWNDLVYLFGKNPNVNKHKPAPVPNLSRRIKLKLIPKIDVADDCLQLLKEAMEMEED